MSTIQILHHSRKCYVLLRMVRVLAAHRAAKTCLLRELQDFSLLNIIFVSLSVVRTSVRTTSLTLQALHYKPYTTSLTLQAAGLNLWADAV